MKSILNLMVIVVMLSSCVKKDNNPVDTQEVTFAVAEKFPSTWMKSTDDYNCIDSLTPDYIKLVITGYADPFYPKIFTLDNNLYAQAIKLPPGTYTVEQFLVMDDMGTPGDLTGDQIYMAIPEEGSTFATYANPVIPFSFNVNDFTKTEIPVEVVCFQPMYYYLFGFNWFAPTEIIIRENCFYGDICVNPDDYLTSFYDLEQPPAGCQVDMPAIMEIVVLKDGEPVPFSPFTNATADASYGAEAPVCVQYPDNLNIHGENFTFQVWVLVKGSVPGIFDYQLCHIFSVIDDGIIADGGDGVVDFAIGDCSPGVDYILPWLPPPE